MYFYYHRNGKDTQNTHNCDAMEKEKLIQPAQSSMKPSFQMLFLFNNVLGNELDMTHSICKLLGVLSGSNLMLCNVR